jgi:hypothetical protein
MNTRVSTATAIEPLIDDLMLGYPCPSLLDPAMPVFLQEHMHSIKARPCRRPQNGLHHLDILTTTLRKPRPPQLNLPFQKRETTRTSPWQHIFFIEEAYSGERTEIQS